MGLYTTAPDAPDIPAAPIFKGSRIYDDEGRLAGETYLDAEGKIAYRPRELTGAEQVTKKAVEAKKQSLLQRLYSTPEEYTRAATEEAGAFAAEQSRIAGRQFERDIGRIGEVSNVRGLLGSKAYADIMGQRERTQAETGAAIAGQSTAMRESLIQAKKGYDYNLYNLYSGIGKDYSAESMRGLQTASQMGLGKHQADIGVWGQEVSAAQQRYQNEMAQWQANDPWRNYIMPILQTAATAAPAIIPLLSDRRLKKNITPLFKVGDIQWYQFEYDTSKWPEGSLPPQPGTHIGVMADEVKHIPGVVIVGPFGYDIVNYELICRHLNMEMS